MSGVLADQQQGLEDAVQEALAQATAAGASAASAGASLGQGLNVSVRLGEVETVEHTRDRSLGVTVFFGQRRGSASTTDLAPASVADTVRAACTIARNTGEDPCHGLPDAQRLATEFPDLELCHPWSLNVEQAVEIARECETAGRDHDRRIENSEGASVSSHEGLQVLGNTLGFLQSVPSTQHSIGCSLIGRDPAGMQRDHWYTSARHPQELETPQSVGIAAARRAIARLGSRQISTRTAAVIYEAPVAASLLRHFLGAIRGSSLYRKATFLLDKLGQPVFAPGVRIQERPFLRRAAGSASFDAEGVATADRDLVANGVLQGYLLDSYAARKLGRETTGNAGGAHNLVIEPGERDLEGLLQQMGTGLLVTELIGMGVNTVTGDYSRGAAGFWVENGVVSYPVEEITVAGNLGNMFRQIREVGRDVDIRGNIRTGSLLLEGLAIAGQ
ncbi:MAG: metalloprotease PmbA [Gammaproteobacteria bacterium]|jgi:PmbA protein|nr:metalloprotease PmbA [Gammaproteobacteria bacterium]